MSYRVYSSVIETTDSTLVCAGNKDGELWAWKPNKDVAPFYVDVHSPISCIASISLNSVPVILVGSDDNLLSFWELRGLSPRELPVERIACDPRSIAAMQPSAQGLALGYSSLALVAQMDGALHVFSMPDGESLGGAMLQPYFGNALTAVLGVSVNDWPIAVSGGFDGTIRLWDLVEITYRNVVSTARERFSERLQRLRIDHMDFTAQTCAELGVSPSTFWSWVNGDSMPRTIEMVHELEAYYMRRTALICPGELVALWNAAKFADMIH
jgi:WD40 repeat protein